MQHEMNQILFSILRSAIRGNRIPESETITSDKSVLQEVLAVAQKHDIAPMIALGILNNGLTEKNSKSEMQQIVFRAVYRYEKLNCELEHIYKVLEAAQIPFVPLKGAVLRQYYPEPWLRTSCDIDVLVRENDLQNAVACLADNLQYTACEKSEYDVVLVSQSGIRLELHYRLGEGGKDSAISQILSDVWNTVVPKEGSRYHYKLPDEMLYFHQVAHMAKHFKAGGCGLRPFVDLWLLDHIDGANAEKRDCLLEKGQLLQFANVARNFAQVCLDNKPTCAVTSQMEAYILKGGVYGTLANSVELQQQKKGGKNGYILAKIFIPYDSIKYIYPVLQKHRWLTPIMQVRRWFKLLFSSRAKRTWREVSYNYTISKSQQADMKAFLDEIGL